MTNILSPQDIVALTDRLVEHYPLTSKTDITNMLSKIDTCSLNLAFHFHWMFNVPYLPVREIIQEYKLQNNLDGN